MQGSICQNRQGYAVLQGGGGGKRDRTDDPLLAKQVLYQLSYAPFDTAFLSFAAVWLVGLGGLEPPTPRLSSVCSNQLSYKPFEVFCFAPRGALRIFVA